MLYFGGCPSWEQALANLETVIQEENLDATVNQIEVNSDKEAVQYRFLGSPSFQVDGVDLWPASRDDFSMNCRVYKTSQGLLGWPTAVAVIPPQASVHLPATYNPSMPFTA